MKGKKLNPAESLTVNTIYASENSSETIQVKLSDHLRIGNFTANFRRNRTFSATTASSVQSYLSELRRHRKWTCHELQKIVVEDLCRSLPKLPKNIPIYESRVAENPEEEDAGTP